MKGLMWGALACASFVALASTQLARPQAVDSNAQPGTAPASLRVAAKGVTGVQLTLDTSTISATAQQGTAFGLAVSGTWLAPGGERVYLQVSDSAGTFHAPQPSLAPRSRVYRLGVTLPRVTASGTYAGTLTVRACGDKLCTTPYPGTTRTVDYTLRVEGIGEWGTLQRNARHDGYVPITVRPERYDTAWTWVRPSSGALSGVVGDGANIYFSEPGANASVRALRAIDGMPRWRRVFTSVYFSGPRLAPPTVSDGIVYATTTGHSDTWLFALRAEDGLQAWQSVFSTQWGEILNPTVHGGRAYVNAGYYDGVVFQFDATTGVAGWSESAGTYGMNTPAVDDDHVYSHNGSTLHIQDAATGTRVASIGPTPSGTYADYNATPFLGTTGRVMAYGGSASNPDSAQRQLLAYSIEGRALSWMSQALYSGFPAVAKGVVYATSNETRTLDALDEATGQVLWRWRPAETAYEFIGNVVATDNVVFASTKTRVYAIDLRKRRTVWSASTPGRLSLASNGMLFVSTPETSFPAVNARITAYRVP